MPNFTRVYTFSIEFAGKVFYFCVHFLFKGYRPFLLSSSEGTLSDSVYGII